MNSDLKFFLNSINCCYNIHYSLYHCSGELLSTVPPKQPQDHHFFLNAGCLELLQDADTPVNLPMIFKGKMGLCWIAVKDSTETGELFHVLGPLLEQTISKQAIHSFLLRSLSPEESIRRHRSATEAFLSYSVVPSTVREQFALMFCYAITQTAHSLSDLKFLNYQIRQQYHSSSGLPEEQYDWQSDQQISANELFRFQAEFLQAIEHGDLSYLLRIYDRAPNISWQFSDSLTPLRRNQNLAIMLLGLCTHASMIGGVIPDTAYRMLSSFLTEIENCTEVSELTPLNLRIYHRFIEQVHYFRRQHNQYSPAVLHCREYIRLHIEDAMDLSSIASHFHYSVYYFSRKFKEECGYSVNDYIKKQKIERAKFLLTDSDLSVNQISSRLHFGSASFFSVTFREITGMPPAKYRQNFGRG